MPTETSAPPQRRSSWWLLWVVVALIAVDVALVVWFRSGGLPRTRSILLDVGEPAPAIKAEGWLNGPPPSESEREGRVVVVDVWAWWCLPCRVRAPEVVDAYERYGDRAIFIGLTAEGEDTLERSRDFLEATKMTWPNGYGALETVLALNAEYLPSSVVIGADGRIAWNSDQTTSLEEGIEQALAAAGE